MIKKIQNFCTQEEIEKLKPVIQHGVVLTSIMGSQDQEEWQKGF